MKPIHLAIIEDDPVIKESLITYLETNPRLSIGFACTSVEDFLTSINATRDQRTEVILLDIGLPGMSGLEGMRHIKAKLPEVNIVILTTYEEEDKIFKALCGGAVSYISKRTPLNKIEEAIITIYNGGSYMSPSIARKVISHFTPKPSPNMQALSERQMQIVNGIVDGLSYKMIADKYLISIDTVRDHIKKIYRLLQVNSKAELIKKSNENNLI
ncbi:response regulator transcription factor [Winogradskyella sp.]|uniref:response regulator n=1 Tax=Winogradskyella sp. TaxID=1883156 RepID=UPI001B145D4D|nr:response regulator transcription factor [Winogradskyella sp.]MBO6880937.1 response regulator transcription factor [Winogradskyella sp.]